jgi:hypothetical protein
MNCKKFLRKIFALKKRKALMRVARIRVKRRFMNS